MTGARTVPGGTGAEPRLPSQRELRLRARWLAEMADEDRDALWDLPLGEVEARFRVWRAETGGR